MNFLERMILRRELNKMLTNIFAHPKTTLIGVGLAIAQVFLNGRTGQAVTMAILTAVLGALSKDPNSTH